MGLLNPYHAWGPITLGEFQKYNAWASTPEILIKLICCEPSDNSALQPGPGTTTLGIPLCKVSSWFAPDLARGSGLPFSLYCESNLFPWEALYLEFLLLFKHYLKLMVYQHLWPWAAWPGIYIFQHFHLLLKTVYYMIMGRCFKDNKNDPELVIQTHIVLWEWEGGYKWMVGCEDLSESTYWGT